MKVVKITRKDLIAGRHSLAKVQDEKNSENVDISKELGDFLYKLLSYSNSKKGDGNGLSFISSSFKMTMSMNFVVRRGLIKDIMDEVITMFEDTYERAKSFYSVAEMNLIILEDGEQFVPPLEENIYDKTTYLKGADVA